MKICVKTFRRRAAMALVVLSCHLAVAQTTDLSPATSVDPATGLPPPVAGALTPDGGLRAQTPREIEAVFNPSSTNPPFQDENMARLQQAAALSASGSYDEAWQRLQALRAAAASGTNSEWQLAAALPVWVALGEKYPPARQSLADMQYEDTRRFARDQGSVTLFRELHDLNDALGASDATFALFKDLRQSQPRLAADCFAIMEPALLARGEYQMSLDHLGNPERAFTLYCNTFQEQNAFNLNMADRERETWRKNDDFLRKLGGPPPPAYPRINAGKHLARLDTNRFVDEVRGEIEILAGTGHRELADKIRDDAIAIADDPRLQSAVTDAVASVQAKLLPGKAAVPPPARNDSGNH